MVRLKAMLMLVPALVVLVLVLGMSAVSAMPEKPVGKSMGKDEMYKMGEKDENKNINLNLNAENEERSEKAGKFNGKGNWTGKNEDFSEKREKREKRLERRVSDVKETDAKERFEKAREWFNETRKNVENVGKEKKFEAWKNHLTAWHEMVKRWVERLELEVQNLNLGTESKERLMIKLQEIEERLSDTEGEINASQNYTELREKAMKTKELWTELRQEIRLAVHEYAINKQIEILERIKQVRDRLEAADVDVGDLNAKIEEIEKAVNDLKNCTGTAEFPERVRDVNRLLREALTVVKELAREVRLENQGFVYAYVNGSFSLRGNFSSVQIKGSGNVTIPESAVVSKVSTPVEKIVAKGNFTASGVGEFRILAHGSGVLSVSGEGYYRVKSFGPLTEEIEFGSKGEGEGETVTFG